MSARRKMPKDDETAQMERIARGFWESDLETRMRKVAQAMEVLDPEQKVWLRETPTWLH